MGAASLAGRELTEISNDLRSVLHALARSPGWPDTGPARIAPGDRIGRYQLERIIGRGRSGIVFAAHDEVKHRKVAIKVTRCAPGGFMPERFEREARIAARLDHPSLVKLHDAGTIEGLPYLVLELLEGRTLASLSKIDLDLDRALAITAGILGALATLHAAGLAHLELAPTNVMLCADGRIKLLDVGLADLHGGTVGDLAPEQTGGGSDPRSDIWAVGMILLELAFGEPRDASAMNLAPMRIRPVLSRALARSPEQRYPDGAAMLVAIEAARVSGRKPFRAGVGAAIAAAAIVATVVPIAVSRWHRETAVDAADLAGRASSEVAAIEARLREAHLQPLHDVRLEEARAKLDLAALALGVGGEVDPIGIPAQIALARGERTVHDLEGARMRLERVIARGARPEALQILGEVLLDQVADERANLWYISDPDKQAVRAKQLEEMRDEGLRDLRDAQPSDQLALARIAMSSGKLDEGVKLATAALAADPMLYEAHYVIGAAYAELADREARAGRRDDATADFRRNREELVAAAAIARSAPVVHQGACRRLQAELEFRRKLGKHADVYDAARAACARATVARPNDPIATYVIAYLDQIQAGDMMERGDDPRPVLQDGFALLAPALELEPRNFELLDAQGVLALMAATSDIARGRDPRTNLALAEQALTVARSLQPESNAVDRLGQVAAMRAEDTLVRGGDPRAEVKRAVEVLAHGDQNLGGVFTGRALVAEATWETQHDLDPNVALDGAIKAFEMARAAKPDLMVAVDEEGGAWQAKAEWERKRGRDGIVALDKSISCSEVVLAADPNDLEGHGNLGEVLILRAKAELDRGGNPRAFVEQAVAHLERAHQIDKDAPGVKVGLTTARQMLALLPPAKR